MFSFRYCFLLNEVAGDGVSRYSTGWEEVAKREWRGAFLASVVASLLFDFMVVSISRW